MRTAIALTIFKQAATSRTFGMIFALVLRTSKFVPNNYDFSSLVQHCTVEYFRQTLYWSSKAHSVTPSHRKCFTVNVFLPFLIFFMNRMFRFAIMLCSIGMLASEASGQVFTCTSPAGTYSWFTPAVGNPWGVGTAGEYPGQMNATATVNINSAVTLTNCVPANSLTSLTISAVTTLQGTGTLTVSGAVTVNQNLVIGSGLNLVVNGTLTIAFGVTLTVNGGATLTLNNTVAIGGTGQIDPQPLSVITLGTGFAGNVIDGSKFVGNAIDGTLEVNTGGGFTLSNPLTISSDSRLRLFNTARQTGGSAIAYTDATSVLEYTGASTSSTGNELLTPTMNGSVTIAKSNGVLTLTPSVTQIDGVCTVASNSFIDIKASKTLILTNNVILSSGKFLTDNTSTLTFSGTGTQTPSPLPLTILGQINTLQLARTVSGSFIANTALVINGAGSQLSVGNNCSLFSTGNSIRIETGFSTVAGTLIIEPIGSLFVKDGASLNNTGTISIRSNATCELDGGAVVSGAGTFTYTNATSVLRYSGTLPNVSGNEFPNSPTVMNGSVDITNTVAFPPYITLPNSAVVNGSFTLGNTCTALIPNTGFLRLNGAITFVGSQCSLSGGDFVVGTISPVPNPTPTITGSVRSTGFKALTMNRATRTFMFDQNATAPQPLIIDTLQMQNGYILSNPTSGRELKISNQNNYSVIGGSATSFVIGPLTRTLGMFFSGGTDFLFPVGRDSTYLPLKMENVSTVGISPEISVEAFRTPFAPVLSTGVASVSNTQYWLMRENTANFYTSGQVRLARPGSLPAASIVVYASSLLSALQNGGGTRSTDSSSVISNRLPGSGSQAIYALGTGTGLPVITSFTPSTGGTATTATIFGVNLSGTTQVLFGTRPARSFTIAGSGSLTAVVDSLTITGKITVITNSGSTTSSQVFTYTTTPTISSISQTIGGTGTRIVIRGQNFAFVRTITVGGVPVQSFTTDSLNQITAIVSSKGGTGAVAVGTLGGSVSSQQTFTFYNPPTITSFTPTLGARSTFVTVTGTNFVKDFTTVFFGGVTALAVTVNSPTSLLAVVGNGSTGFVAVQAPGGTVTSATMFVHGGPPIIGGITPLSGVPGTPITITGANLLGVTKVEIGTTTTTFTINTTTQQITAITPFGTTGGTIRITAVGGSTTSTQRFTVLPSFTITGFSPTSGTAGTVVTITGTNFSTISSVQIAGTAASFSVISTTRIVAIVGNISTSGTVTVTGLGGTTSSTATFTRVPVLPRIDSFAPSSITAGTVLTIKGAFLTGVQSISIAGVAAPEFRNVSSTQVTVTIPRNATNGTITIRNALGSFTTTAILTVLQGPFINEFTPSFGTTGATISITGGNFAGATQITFGSVTSNVLTVISDSLITAIVPADALRQGTQSGTIVITTPRGNAASRTQFDFVSQFQLDSIALASIYRSTGGKNWVNSDQWFAPDRRISDWFGVKIDTGRGRVVELRLSNNNLKGALPEALAMLTALRTLDLDSNALDGTMPAWIGNLRQLDSLSLSGNKLSGTLPDTLSTLPKLKSLDLSGNQFAGALPQTFCAFRAIEFLDVSNNNLQGTIPPCLGTLTKLISLNLGQNRFGGTIPAELAQLTALQVLQVNNNRLSGSIPSEFGLATLTTGKSPNDGSVQAVSRLQILDASNNRLFGELPPSLANLSALIALTLQNNTLTNTNTASLAAILGKLSNLRVLNLANNQFQDSIPSVLGSLKKLEALNLSNNTFSGSIPATFATSDSKLTFMLLDTNQLSGILDPAYKLFPPNLQVLSLSANRLTGLLDAPSYSFQNTLSLQTVNVGGNALNFAHLENNTARISSFTYIPQDSIGTARDTSIVLGTEFRLAAVATGGNSNLYQWFKDGKPVGTVGDASSSYTVRTFSVADTGVYVCRVTNPSAPDLTLYSRPLTVRSVLPDVPVEAPVLVFPPDKATAISSNPLLQWQAVRNATQYEINVSLTPGFTTLASSATSTALEISITGLKTLTPYFWRVRGTNVGGSGAWSAPFSFTTVTAGTIITINSIDFGRVVLNERETRTARVVNVSNTKLTLSDVNVTDADLNFRTDLANIRNVELLPNRFIDVQIDFAPKSTGKKIGITTLKFTPEGTTAATTITYYDGLVVGVGGALKTIAADFDTVRVGRASLTTMLLINRDSKAAKIALKNITPVAGSNPVFSIEPNPFADTLYLAGGDTSAIVLRCQPTATGTLTGLLNIKADVDSVQGSIRAIARQTRTDDVFMTVGIRPEVDSVAPGQPVKLRLSIASGDLSTLRQALPRFEFRAVVRYDKNVLRVNDTTKIATRFYAISSDHQNRFERVFNSPTLWSGKDDLLATIATIAVSGDTDRTPLQIERFDWALTTNATKTGIQRIFVEVPTNGLFISGACRAGGTTRLTRSTTALALSRAQPNPVQDAATISYSVREQGFIELALYDIMGKKITSVVRGDHAPGEYITTFSANGIPVGTYFLVLQSPSAILNERVEVVR